MQRALAILAVFVLVTVALAVGVLAAHWPFWSRAWAWQQAPDGWPVTLPGPTLVMPGGDQGLALQFSALPGFTASSSTHLVLVAGADGRGLAFLSEGHSPESPIDGRGLAAALLPPLYGPLLARQPAALDVPARTFIKSWQDDSRGEVTPRQLLWQLSGFPDVQFQPLNPASFRAQLASGPNFDRAARHWRQVWPAGSHFEFSPVNAQLASFLLARQEMRPYSQLLMNFWGQFASGDLVATLDHPRGQLAAHCCMRASAADWLRLGLLLADDGAVAGRQVLPKGFVAQLQAESAVHPGQGLGFQTSEIPGVGRTVSLQSTGRLLLVAPALRRAMLWIGLGSPPPDLHRLLLEAAAGAII